MVVMTLLQRMFLLQTTYFPLLMSPLTRNGCAGCGIYLVYGFNYKCTVGPYIPYIVRQQVGECRMSVQRTEYVGVSG